MAEDFIDYKIFIDAVKAVEQLRELSQSASTFKERMDLATAAARNFSKETGYGMRNTANAFKKLDEEMAKATNTSTVFGNESKAGWDRVGSAAESNAGKSVRSIDAIRIALGALVAMLVFTVIQAFQNMVSGAINGLRELESATFNVLNAEQKLSEQGISISPQQLDETIKKLQQLDPLLSKVQATELVSSVASKVAPNVGLGQKEIESLTQSIAILSIRNKALGKSFEEVESQIENAFLSGKVSVGINQLGVKISDQIVQEKAVAMGLVETADAYDKLDAKQKAHINALTMIQILEENTNKERSHLPEYFKTADAAFGIFQARLSDVLSEIGSQMAPILIKIFNSLADGLSGLYDWLTKNREALSIMVNVGLKMGEIFLKIVEIIAKFGTAMGMAAQAVERATNKVQAFIDKHPALKKIVDTLQKAFPNIAGAPDTPTGPPSTEFSASPEAAQAEDRNKKIQKAEEDLQKILQDSADKKADIERDYQRKLQDIATNYSQKLEDIARNTAEKKEDAARNYTQKVEDINRDADERIAQAQQDARQREIDREKEYQQRLKELRDKFLFDLEDALRERDARQVLRLMRQYNMDKANLEAKHKIDEEQGKKDLQQKIADIERDRQLKLEAAKREYDDKLKEIAIGEARARDEARIWQQRQLQDARIWHQRQLAEQREYLQRKLRDLAAALAQELKMTQQGAQAIASTLSSVFGSALNGLIPVNGSGAVTGGSLGNGSNWGQLANTWNSLLSTWQNSGLYGTQGLADGGSLLATRPTTLNVGEKTPELVTAIPLNKIGQASSFLPNGMTQSQGGGSLSLRIMLSDGLIADIVDTSLDNVATQIEKIVRSK